MRVGILTGGGDCPALNAVIRAVVRTLYNSGVSTVGFLEGWRGAIEGNTIDLEPRVTDDVVDRGGTILGSSRTNPFKNPNDRGPIDKILSVFREKKLDALVAIGGDDTLGVARKLYDQEQFPCVGCPKTIDNDLSCTDYTFGFDTAVNIVMESVDRIRTTADSHRRVMVIETMGRHAGWIACFSAIATGADYLLVPEVTPNLDEMCELLLRRRKNGKHYGIVIVSEGVELPEIVQKEVEVDQFGHKRLGGIADDIAEIIEKRTKLETRAVVLGHLQRGGPPSAFDRVLGTRLGIHAAQLVLDKKFGRMVALRGMNIVDSPLADAVSANRKLDLDFYNDAIQFMNLAK